MFRAVMMSIRPQHAVDILNGKKTLELRKRVPKRFKGWIYIYVTKPRKKFRVLSQSFYEDYLYRSRRSNYVCSTNFELWELGYENPKDYELNGKVVARFWFDDYDKLITIPSNQEVYCLDTMKYRSPNYNFNYVIDRLCLTLEEIDNYGKGKNLYALHIKQLEIFDEPMGLNEFYGILKGKNTIAVPTDRLMKAPQSWQYVYVRGNENEI